MSNQGRNVDVNFNANQELLNAAYIEASELPECCIANLINDTDKDYCHFMFRVDDTIKCKNQPQSAFNEKTQKFDFSCYFNEHQRGQILRDGYCDDPSED